eukprot:3684482-Prymnesium_polylepis.1
MPPRLLPHERRIPHCPPSQLQPIAPIVPIGGPKQKAVRTREGSAADRRANPRRHLLIVEHDRAPAGGRRGAWAGEPCT